MAGPVTLILGAFAFEALGFSFIDLQTGVETPWAENQIAGGWDNLQWLGPGKATASIRGVLFPEHLGGEQNLSGTAALQAAGVPMPLISLGGQAFGLFVVERLSEDQSVFSGRGVARMNKYSISLRKMPVTSLMGAAGGVVRLFT